VWLAGRRRRPGNDWPARVLADDNLPPVAADSVLGQLLQATIKQLEDRDFAFELLLTDTTTCPRRPMPCSAGPVPSWAASAWAAAAVARPCPKRAKKR
jgi:hypothetical protein